MNSYIRNLITLPVYTPLWICDRDISQQCIILSEPLIVDDQREYIDVGSISGYIDDKYWHWDVPLLVDGTEDQAMIISHHGKELKKKVKDVVKSLISHSPCDIIIERQARYQSNRTFREIVKVGKGDPIIVVPEIAHDLHDIYTDEYIHEDFFTDKENVEGAYAVVTDPYDLEYSDIIHDTSVGPITVYVKRTLISLMLSYERYFSSGLSSEIREIYTVYMYGFTTEITDDPVYLYGDHIVYFLSETREDLLKQVDRYIRKIPMLKPHIPMDDIDIYTV